MTYPVHPAYITCDYGRVGSMWAAGHHTGRDYRARTPVPVFATEPGKIIHAGWGGWGPDYGIHVIVDSGERRHLYAHLSREQVSVGQHVWAGEQLGTSGHTGNAPAPHLHYEERVAPFTYWNARRPIFDVNAFDFTISAAAVKKAVTNHRSIDHGVRLKKALAAEVGRGGMLLGNATLGSSFQLQYRALQKKWYGGHPDGIPGQASLARLGGLHDFGVKA